MVTNDIRAIREIITMTGQIFEKWIKGWPASVSRFPFSDKPKDFPELSVKFKIFPGEKSTDKTSTIKRYNDCNL